jgi:methyltransferase family protein
MLELTRRRLFAAIKQDSVVLDVGGWADPFERADWVIDLMPYETRGLYQRQGWAPRRTDPERFGPDTWIQRDICDHEPYPFADDEIDFAICSQTLEDVRDPIWVCRELTRIAKGGYIEVPSRLEEQSWGVNGPCAGWSHHRWLIDVQHQEIEFVMKPHSLGRAGQHFPDGFWQLLTDEERIQTLWWEGDFRCLERVIVDEDESERYLSAYVARELAARSPLDRSPTGGRRPGARELLRRLRNRGRAARF